MKILSGIDCIGVVACAMVHDGNGKILLMKRGKNARDEHGRWDICAGAIDFGETIEACLNRELKEELCTIANEIKFLSAGEAHRDQNGVNTHWVYLLYAVRVNEDSVKLGEPDKFDDFGWFNLNTLPTPMHSQFLEVKETIMKDGILK